MNKVFIDFFKMKSWRLWKKDPVTSVPVVKELQPTKPTERRIQLSRSRAFVCCGEYFMVQPGQYIVDRVIDENTKKMFVVFVGIDAPGVVGAEASVWDNLFKIGLVKFI